MKKRKIKKHVRHLFQALGKNKVRIILGLSLVILSLSLRLIYLSNIEKGLLSLRNNGKDVYYNLKTKKTKLLMVPFGEDHIQTVAAFFQRDEGVDIYKAFQDMLKS